MRYQQMRQNAMRAFVAQAGQAEKPAPSKRRVDFSSIEEHNQIPLDVPGLTAAEYDPVTQAQIPGKQASGTGSVSYEADSASGVRCVAPVWFQDGDVTYGLVFFNVNGERREPQRIIGSDAQWTDVAPGTDNLVVKALYNQYV